MDSLRISDADREAAVDLLGEQYALGRLTRDEFDERSDAVWSAKTQGDLAPIFADLPVRPPAGLGRRRGSLGAAPPALVAGCRSLPVLIVLVVLTVVDARCRSCSCCVGAVPLLRRGMRHGWWSRADAT